MNKRIKELMVKSGAYDHYEINEGVDGDELPMVKFAELIVKECCRSIRPELRDMISRGKAVDIIKEHFGIEE